MQNILREIKLKRSFNVVRQLFPTVHIHDDIELIYVREGHCTAYCDGKRYTLTKDSYFLTFPNQIHHYTDCQQGQYMIIIMKPAKLLHLKTVFEEGQPESALCSGSPELRVLLEMSYAEFRQDKDSCVVDGLLTAFFGKLLKHYRLRKYSAPHNCVPGILQYCTQHFREDISIDDIAKHLHISRSHISHIFSRRFQISFCDYINTLRISEAVLLMQNRAYSITQIAGLSGFSTIRTFNRAFQKQHGICPSKYRKNLFTQEQKTLI